MKKQIKGSDAAVFKISVFICSIEVKRKEMKSAQV